MIRVCWSGCAPQIVPLTILFFFLINWTQPRVSPQNVVFLPSFHPSAATWRRLSNTERRCCFSSWSRSASTSHRQPGLEANVAHRRLSPSASLRLKDFISTPSPPPIEHRGSSPSLLEIPTPNKERQTAEYVNNCPCFFFFFFFSKRVL